MGAFSQFWSLIKDCSLLVDPLKLQTVTGKFTISKLTGNTSKDKRHNKDGGALACKCDEKPNRGMHKRKLKVC